MYIEDNTFNVSNEIKILTIEARLTNVLLNEFNNNNLTNADIVELPSNGFSITITNDAEGCIALPVPIYDFQVQKNEETV